MKYFIVPLPNLPKGRKPKNLLVVDSRGEIVFTEWKKAKNEKAVIKEMEKILKNQAMLAETPTEKK